MTDIDVRGGGAVAVDTDTLRHAAGLFSAAGAELESIGLRLGALQNMLFVERQQAWDAASAAAALGERIRAAREESAVIASSLREAAATYEIVELNAAHAAAVSSGDQESVRRIESQRRLLAAEYPDAWETARFLAFERTVMWPSELVRQATLLGFDAGWEVSEGKGGVYGGVALGVGTIAFATTAGGLGAGLLARDARLAGPTPAVALVPIPTASTGTTGAPAVAPASLAAATTRIPSGGESRVRVERYTMPDGSQQFALYVAGTESWSVGGDDPFDAQSNVELYTGRESASYAATAQALAAAGAEPGDTVHAFAFSQGAMVTSHLALEGGYDVATLVSAGSPVEADVSESTLSVNLRHTDDPIAALAGGGHAGSVGAPGSFVVEVSADPDTDLGDARAPAHRLTAYTETAALVDASRDPRVDAVRAVLDDLATATSVDVVEYGAVRLATPVSPSTSDGG